MQAQENIIITIAGKDSAGFSGDGGPATDAKLYTDEGFCLDNFGNLYIADGYNNRIRKVKLSTGIITTIAGTDSAGYNGDGIAATNAKIYFPTAVFTDTIGNVFIADAGNNRIRKISISTGLISTIAGSGPIGVGAGGNSGDGGIATNAQLSVPVGLYIDKYNNIFICDYGNNKVRKVEYSTGIITTFAGIGSSTYSGGYVGYSGDGGSATNAQFSGIAYCFADTIGNLFICDQWNHVVRKVDAITGIVTTIAGNGTVGYSGDGGLAINAQLNQPVGIFVDDRENIFIAEYGDGVIRKIDGTSGNISTIAGTGTRGYSGDGGPATAAELKCSEVFVDKYGVIYIADIDNNRVRMVYNTAMGVGNVKMGNGENVQIYPNPVNDEFHIDNAANSEVRMFNLLGQEVFSGKLNSSKESVDIRGLPSGTYVVQIISGSGEVQNYRVVKE